MPITLDDINAWEEANPDTSQAGASGGAGSPSVPLPSRPEFARAFPHLAAFTEGLTDAVSLGMVKPTQKRDFLSTEGAAEVAGMIVGEIPFWLTGGFVAKKLIGVAVRTANAGKMSAAFGKTVKLAQKHGVEIGEAAGAIGVTAGRDVVSDDPADDLTPFNVAIDVSLPFAMSAVKLGKRFGARKKELQAKVASAAKSRRAHERFVANAHASESEVRKLAVSDAASDSDIHIAREADLNNAFDSFRPEDAKIGAEMENLFTVHGGDNAGHLEMLYALFRQGAPLDDLYLLHHADDIADYLQLQRTYPINRPAIKTWEDVAKERKSTDMLLVKELLRGRMRSHRSITKPTIEGDDLKAAAKRPGAPTTQRQIQQNQADANLRQLESRMNAETGLIDVDMVRCPRK